MEKGKKDRKEKKKKKKKEKKSIRLKGFFVLIRGVDIFFLSSNY